MALLCRRARPLKEAAKVLPSRQHARAVARAALAQPAQQRGAVTSMRAAMYHEFCGPVHVEEVARPAAPAGGVLLEVMATGLCRSDWHGWQGHDDDIKCLPHVPGHELAGKIVEVGVGVSNFRRGDAVLVPFILSCGACHYCSHSAPTVCLDQQQPGFHIWGSYAQYVALPRADRNLTLLPKGVGFNSAAALGCRISTAYRGLSARAALQEGEWLCVVGCGGLGLAAVSIGKALGAKVIACDVRQAALDYARKLGADGVVLVKEEEEVQARIREVTGRGAHVSVEASGWSASARIAARALQRCGRMVQLGLPLGAHANPQIPMALVAAWELSLLGGHGAGQDDIFGLLGLIKSGRLAPEAMITKEVGLSEACGILMQMGEAQPEGMYMITDFCS